MPEIARFFGIIIRMFAEAGAPHHSPHFHAYYQNHIAIHSIDTIELINEWHLTAQATAACGSVDRVAPGRTFRKLGKVAIRATSL
jgi:hypothetical protein